MRGQELGTGTQGYGGGTGDGHGDVGVMGGQEPQDRAGMAMGGQRGRRTSAHQGPRSPGCRVPRVPARVTCLGALSFQRKVERFLEAPGEATPPDGATGRAIALVNCCPPFR